MEVLSPKWIEHRSAVGLSQERSNILEPATGKSGQTGLYAQIAAKM